MKVTKEQMLEAYNEFKSLIEHNGYDFKYNGIQSFKNGKYAVLNFGKDFDPEKNGWEITEYVDGDVLSALYNLYKNGIKQLKA